MAAARPACHASIFAPGVGLGREPARSHSGRNTSAGGIFFESTRFGPSAPPFEIMELRSRRPVHLVVSRCCIPWDWDAGLAGKSRRLLHSSPSGTSPARPYRRQRRSREKTSMDRHQDRRRQEAAIIFNSKPNGVGVDRRWNVAFANGAEPVTNDLDVQRRARVQMPRRRRSPLTASSTLAAWHHVDGQPCTGARVRPNSAILADSRDLAVGVTTELR